MAISVGWRRALAAFLLWGGTASAATVAVQAPPADVCAARIPSAAQKSGAPLVITPQSCQAKPAGVRSRLPARAPSASEQNRIAAARARIGARLKELRARHAEAGAFFDHSAARADRESSAHGSEPPPLLAWIHNLLTFGQSSPPKPLHRPFRRPSAARPRRRDVEPPFPHVPPPSRQVERFSRGLTDGLAAVAGGVTTIVGAGVNATTGILQQVGGFAVQGSRVVVNSLFKGVEMVQGVGYTLIHAADRHTNYGTTRLVLGVQRIAAYMRESGIVQTELVIGDMSRWDGAKIGRHLSHRKGIDMDIGYYMVDAQGRPVQGTDLIPLDRSLRGRQGKQDVYLDAPRVWQLVRAFLSSPDFKVQWIFVAPWIKAALLKEAARINDPLRGAANKVLDTNWPGHNSHLHLRVQ